MRSDVQLIVGRGNSSPKAPLKCWNFVRWQPPRTALRGKLTCTHRTLTLLFLLPNPCRVYLAMLGSFTSLCFADSPAAASFWAEHYSKPAVHSGVLLFIVSKLFELGDTLFLAALGKPIIFLHW